MRFVAPACALLMGFAAFLAARLTYAETIAQQYSRPALLRAADLDRFAPPADYFEHLAEIDSDHAAKWLDAALLANPRLSRAWIEKGLEAERSGDLRDAEASLLQAASVDRRYLPAWTLTNFYFRRNRWGEFWTWARRAAGLAYDDFRPLLALAHAIEPDPQAAVSKLGGGQRLIEADVDYLTGQGRLDDAQNAARLLLAGKSPAEAPRILELTQRQIGAGHARHALELWNAVQLWKGVDAPPLDPEGRASTNGEFASAPTGATFDWQLPPHQGFSSAWKPGVLTLRLSGEQPESCSLLEQPVPLDPARRYRLQYEYVTSGVSPPTGLTWELDGAAGMPIPPAETPHSGEAIILPGGPAPGAEPTLARLRLLYSRAPGTTRVRGEIRLRRVRLEAQ